MLFQRVVSAGGFAAIVMTSVLLAAKPPWEKPADAWTQQDVDEVLNRSPWALQTDATMADPYDEREPQPAGPPDTGQTMPGQQKRPWDGGVGKNRMGRLATVPVLVRWETALPVRLAEKQNDDDENQRWYVISVAGLVPAHQYQANADAGAKGQYDAQSLQEVVDSFTTNSKITQRGGVDLVPDHVKFDPASGVARLYFSRHNALDPEQKEVVFETHFGKLGLHAKFRLSSMKYHGNTEL